MQGKAAGTHPSHDPRWIALTPPDRPTPLVVDSPHSGCFYPPEFHFLPSLDRMRRAEDAHVDRLLERLPAAGAPVLAARFPRTYIDVNRALHDLDAALIAGPWPEPLRPGARTRAGRGLVWRTLGHGDAIYAGPLDAAEIRGRIDTCYRPYHALLAGLLDGAQRRFGQVWHLDMHSMASLGGRLAPDGHGSRRPDFALGDRDGTAASTAFTALVARTLADLGYRVAVNRPYRGAEVVRRHGRPGEGRHSLQVEVRRGLYMDERSGEPHEGLARIAADLETLARRIVAWAGAG